LTLWLGLDAFAQLRRGLVSTDLKAVLEAVERGIQNGPGRFQRQQQDAIAKVANGDLFTGKSIFFGQTHRLAAT